MDRRVCLLILLGLFAASCVMSKESTFDPALCADSSAKLRVRDFYEKTRPGAPMPIPSRELELVETKIVSALPPSQAVGTVGSPERFKEIWRSIDNWGADNWINIVITVDGYHAFNFPSKVPITQEFETDAFYHTFADEGKGMHGHLNPDLIEMIYAVKIPDHKGTYLRAVCFYDKDGDLIIGVYATEPGEEGVDQVLAGFDDTWNIIAAMPLACKE